MNMPVGKRVLVISIALAAGGVLACVAALFNVLVPKGSLLAFFAALVPLALAIIGVMVGFVNACEKCEDWLHGRRDRLFGVEEDDHDEPVGPVDPREPTHRDSRPVSPEALRSSARQDPTRYVLGLRGPSPKSSTTGAAKPSTPEAMQRHKVWHGQ
jgi:hypothetical protein